MTIAANRRKADAIVAVCNFPTYVGAEKHEMSIFKGRRYAIPTEGRDGLTFSNERDASNDKGIVYPGR